MLNDGIRYFNIDICTSEKKNLVVCSSDKTFEDVLNEAFIFARETPEQFFIVNLGSEDIKQVEKVMDKVCKAHTELTAGTDEYVELKCPFIYKHEKGPWPSIGELVNYNPEQAQWEGDGELVGVRTKMLFTTSSKDGYISPYFTPTFWREFQGSGLSELKQELKKGCRVPAGGIKLNAYSRVDKDCSSAEELTIRKDQFIELAQAALEQAKNEEKGVLQELIETFLKHTGAPMVADALIQQLKSQEVIEKLAENHYNQQKPAVTYPLILKEPDFKQTKEPKYQHSSNILISV
ncbi:hypothetical protein G6F56_004885 [Rhizopus delemar]|nr:hypothetical protein G6F56_004885 [Rhizopus delemar]